MKVEQLTEDFPYTPPVHRTHGIHLSDVIRAMAVELFGLKRKGEPDLLQFEKGFVWERVLSHAFGEGIAQRPGELECDGIWCSPDGITVGEDGEFVVEEYKCTTVSSRKSPEDVWVWKMQVMGYCYVVGADAAVFRVFYLMGDYKNLKPEYKVWRCEFTQAELADAWASIVAHAQTMKEEMGDE